MYGRAVTIVTALLLSSSLSTAVPLFAQEEAPAPVSNNDKIPRAWFLRIEGGAAKIHDRDPSSAWLGARVGREIPRNGNDRAVVACMAW